MAAPVPRAAPTIPLQLKSFASAAISSACSCLPIPTKTNTTTQGVPLTVQAQATTTTLVVSTVTVAQTNAVTQYTTVHAIAEGSAWIVQRILTSLASNRPRSQPSQSPSSHLCRQPYRLYLPTQQPSLSIVSHIPASLNSSHHPTNLNFFPTACQPPGLSYGSGGNTGGGRSLNTFNVGSFQDCCNACFYGTTKDCITYDYTTYEDYHFCQLTVSNAKDVDPALANAQCPLGQRENAFAGLKMKNANGIFLGPCLGIADVST
jgi:hypothetical protein